MKTTARIQLPTGIHIAPTVPALIDFDHKKGECVVAIMKVDKLSDGRSIVVDLELDIDLDVAFNPANHPTPNKRGVLVGIVEKDAES